MINWIRKKLIRNGKVIAGWPAKDLREDKMVVDVSKLNENLVGIRRRRYGVLAKVAPPDFETIVEWIPVSDLWRTEYMGITDQAIEDTRNSQAHAQTFVKKTIETDLLQREFTDKRKRLLSLCDSIADDVLLTNYPYANKTSELLLSAAEKIRKSSSLNEKRLHCSSIRSLFHRDGFAEYTPPNSISWDKDVSELYDLAWLYVEAKYKPIYTEPENPEYFGSGREQNTHAE